MRKSKGKIDKDGRECSRCGEYYTWEHYHRKTISSTGHTEICKKCSKPYHRAQYLYKRRRLLNQRPTPTNLLFDTKSRQWRLLTILATQPGLDYKTIAAQEGLSTSYVNVTFARMAAKIGANLGTGTGGHKTLIAYFWHCHYQGQVLSFDEFWSLQEQARKGAKL